MDFDKLRKVILEKSPATSMKAILHNDQIGDWGYDADLKKILGRIEHVRKDPINFKLDDDDKASMAHTRGTPNSPASSRGTLVVMMDLVFKDGGEGSIVVVDLAGAEDPVTLIGGYM